MFPKSSIRNAQRAPPGWPLAEVELAQVAPRPLRLDAARSPRARGGAPPLRAIVRPPGEGKAPRHVGTFAREERGLASLSPRVSSSSHFHAELRKGRAAVAVVTERLLHALGTGGGI